MSINLNHAQAQSLIEILQDNIDGESVLLTDQSDGSVYVAFNLVSFVVALSGEVEEA